MSDEPDRVAGPADWPPWNDVLRWIESELGRASRRYRLPDDERNELRQRMSLRVVSKIGEFDPDSGAATLETWVRQRSVWTVADYWRGRLRLEGREGAELTDSAGESEAPARDAHRNELRAMLEACLSRLTERQRDRYLRSQKALDERTTLSSVARALDISRDTLKESVARARVLLRRCMSAAGFSPLDPERAPPDGGGLAV